MRPTGNSNAALPSLSVSISIVVILGTNRANSTGQPAGPIQLGVRRYSPGVLSFPLTPFINTRWVARTTRWARRCLEAYDGPGTPFGIVQGGVYPDLRERSVRELLLLR